MYFSGRYSKFDEGQQVFYKAPDSTLYQPCTINTIGILGTKLSENLFLYNITDTAGKNRNVTEETLSVDCDGNRTPKALHLVLKHEWYERIWSGLKDEEYRIIKPCWARRFLWYNEIETADELDMLCSYLAKPQNPNFAVDMRYINYGGSGQRVDSNGIPYNDLSAYMHFGLNLCKYQYVVFHKGYTKETMRFEIKSLRIGQGDVNNGAPKDKNVFIIKLGKHCE